MVDNKNKRTHRRKMRVSANIVGSAVRPRISIYRSNRYIYAQAIDDGDNVTLAGYSSLHLLDKSRTANGKKTEQAKAVGKGLAMLLKQKQINTAVYDRGSYAYKGRVKAVAEGLRESGITI